MVQCAVGNRCKKCAGKFSTHLVKMTPMVITKVVLLSFASSYLIIATEHVASLSVPICMIGPISVAVSAYFLGGFIHKASGYKDGKLLTPFILIPLVIGFLVNPFGGSPVDLIRLMTVAGVPFNFDLLLPFFFTPALSCFMILVQPNQTRSV